MVNTDRKATRTNFGWDYGEGVFHILGEDFGENLALLKKTHPELVVTAMSPIFGGYRGVSMNGLYVVCERKTDW